MSEAITQLGVGCRVALLIIREFVSFSKGRKMNGAAKKESNLVTMELCELQHKNLDSTVADIKTAQGDIHSKVNKICTSVELIKNDVKHIKNGSH